MTGPEKPGKSKEQAAGSRQTGRRRKATSAPIIDLEATEVREEPAASGETKPEAETGTAGAAQAGTEAMAKPASEPASIDDPAPGGADVGADEMAEGAPEAEPAPPTPAEHRRNLMTIGVAAAAGAVIGAVLVVAVDRLAGPGGETVLPVDLSTIETRLDGLERAASQGGSAQQIEARLGRLEQDAAKAAEAAPASAQVTERLDALDQAVSETRSRAQSALDGLQAIEAAVRDIGSRPSDGAGAPSIEALELKIANLAQRIDRMAEGERTGDGSDLAAKVTALTGEVDRLRDSLAGLGSEIKAMPPAADAQSVAALKSDLTARLDVIDERLGGPGETRGAAAAIALASLRRTVEKGEPFERELAAFKALVPGDGVVAVLEPHAAGGIKTRATLAEEFPKIATAADLAGESGDGLGARILSRLQSVVHVRRTGEAGDRSPAAVVARMVQAVRQGDLSAAVKESAAAGEALPDGIRAWAKEAKARLDAETALDEADDRMIAILGRTGG